MDAVDRRIINGLQGGFPLCERPFAVAAARLGLSEEALIARIEHLLKDGTLTRFGPLFNADRMGGKATLCAMHVPAPELEHAIDIVNNCPEVAHNYERDHHLNVWFVVATESPSEIESVLARIATDTGFPVLDFPKSTEYYVGLRLEV